MKDKIYACACLKDNELIFWHTGYSKRENVWDFGEDFYTSGLDMIKETKNHNYVVVTKQIKNFDKDKKFYKQFKLTEHYDEYNAIRPY